MKLWLLTMINTIGRYDINRGGVVRAETAEDARYVMAGQAADEYPTEWLNPELSTCEEITLDGPPETILLSFKAG